MCAPVSEIIVCHANVDPQGNYFQVYYLSGFYVVFSTKFCIKMICLLKSEEAATFERQEKFERKRLDKPLAICDTTSTVKQRAKRP